MNEPNDSFGTMEDTGTNLVSRVQQVLKQMPFQALPTLVVAAFALEADEMRGILSLPEVAGCIHEGASTDEKTRNTGLISASGEWEFPDVAAGSVTYLGWSRSIRPRRLYESMRRGIPRVLAMDAHGRWKLKRIPFWYLAYLGNRLQQSPPSLPETLWLKRVRSALSRARKQPPERRLGDRILLVTGTLAAGGAERQVLNTAVSLSRVGLHVEVLYIHTGKPELDFYRQALEQHVRVWALKDILPVFFRDRDRQFGSFLESIRIGQSNAFLKLVPAPLVDDVVSLALSFVILQPTVVHLWQDHTNLVGGFAGLMAGVPRIVMAGRSVAPYHYPCHRRYMHRVYRLLLGFPEVSLLNNSKNGARSYAEWLGLERDEVAVVHNGIDVAAFSGESTGGDETREQWRIPCDALLVGGVFRLSREKDPLLWLATAAQVRKEIPAAYFVLMGEGAMREQVEARVRELGLTDCVHLAGLVDDMRRAYATLDVLLLASENEGLPNVLIEAQLAGCPVVAPDVGGCAETVRHGDTGWIVGERSAQALAERVSEVLKNDTWRAQSAHRGPRHIKEAFGLEHMLDETLRVYGLESRG